MQKSTKPEFTDKASLYVGEDEHDRKKTRNEREKQGNIFWIYIQQHKKNGRIILLESYFLNWGGAASPLDAQPPLLLLQF